MKTKWTKSTLILASILASFAFLQISSCKKSNSGDQPARIVVYDKSDIQDRIAYDGEDSVIEVSNDNLKKGNDKFKIYYRARVKSPKEKGDPLRATHIDIKGTTAYVCYNYEGETYEGGLDVVDISDPVHPDLISSAWFTDTDVSGMHYDTSTDKLYLATATEDASFEYPAVLEEISLQNGIPTTESRRIAIKGYVATDVTVADGRVFVTSGDNGGLSVVSQSDFSLTKFIELEDARSVEVTSDYVIVMQGTPARINYYDRVSLNFISSYTFDAANEAEAKSAFCISKEKLFIGGGDKGLLITDLNSGTVTETIPIEDVPGVDFNKIRSNAVTVQDDLIIIANGEAGTYVAEFDYVTNTATMLGRTQFHAKESANFVMISNDWLFIARGKDGFHIVQIER